MKISSSLMTESREKVLVLCDLFEKGGTGVG